MTTQCDGGCLANLPWHFDGKKNELQTVQSLQAFSIPAFLAGFKKVTGIYGLAFTAPAKIPFQVLCDKCWAKAAAAWNGGAATYANIPAKCADTGVYFRANAPEWQDKAKAPDLTVIEPVIIHEMVHFLSKDHVGLQAFEDGKALHWDEAVTDFLARETWGEVAKGPYKTFYGNLSTHMKFAMDNTLKTKLAGPKLAGLQGEAGSLPAAFADALGDLDAGKLKPPRSAAIEKIIQGWLIQWHQQGPAVKIVAANNKNLAEFAATAWGQYIMAGAVKDATLGYGTLGVFK